MEKEDELEEGTVVLLTQGLGEPSDTTDISAADDLGFPPLLDVVLMVLCVSFAIMVPLIFGMPVCYIQRSWDNFPGSNFFSGKN